MKGETIWVLFQMVEMAQEGFMELEMKVKNFYTSE